MISRARRDPQFSGKQATICACWLMVLVTTATAQQKISGNVSDPTGAAIRNAAIEFRANEEVVKTATDDAGNFSVLSAQTNGTLSVSSPGFNTVRMQVSTTNGPLDIQLAPAGVVERIMVGTNAERIPSTPTSEFVVTQRELELSGALTLDDLLRQVPGFSLFRRSGSLSANPTSQGVSLRGIGANGASRALVLLDGVPLNTPFGGWVYWNRVPRVSIEEVYVHNGATSDFFGSGALGGVINMRSKTREPTSLKFEASIGNETTGLASFSFGKLFGDWAMVAAGQALHTATFWYPKINAARSTLAPALEI